MLLEGSNRTVTTFPLLTPKRSDADLEIFFRAESLDFWNSDAAVAVQARCTAYVKK